MDELNFQTIAKAWKRLVSDPDKVSSMQTQSPSLTTPAAIRLKNIVEQDGHFHIRFSGFENASSETAGIPIIKRMILNWMKQIAEEVKVMDSTNTDLNLLVSNRSKFTEAAISIYHRNPKTNKVTRKYKCMGGPKNGRKVSDPNQCLQYPSVAKKISLSISKRATKGQSAKARTKTKLTNIVSRKVRKANQRLKKARGF